MILPSKPSYGLILLGVSRLTYPFLLSIDKTIIWSYDVGGNITSRTEYAYTTGSVGIGINLLLDAVVEEYELLDELKNAIG